MPEEITDPWIIGFILILASASFATWTWLIARRNHYGYVLPYEPRRSVPWNVLATLLAIIFVALSLSSAVDLPTAPPVDQRARPLQPVDFAGSIVMQTTLVALFVAAAAAASRATPIDLGLPKSARQAASDVGIGIVAWLASIIPVHGLNMLLTWLLAPAQGEEQHPLIDMMLKNPEPVVLLLGTTLAVVVAPISEEFAFRLLLQGWLEKWEDRTLRLPTLVSPALSTSEAPDLGATPSATDDQTLPSGERLAMTTADDVTYPEAAEKTLDSIAREAELLDEPLSRGLIGLPHGWLPILISSVLFAAAHAGHGAMALFPLACILGYLYQRTHRILPCIVTHALFNLTSTLVLWRIVSSQAQ